MIRPLDDRSARPALPIAEIQTFAALLVADVIEAKACELLELSPNLLAGSVRRQLGGFVQIKRSVNHTLKIGRNTKLFLRRQILRDQKNRSLPTHPTHEETQLKDDVVPAAKVIFFP